MFSPSLFPTLAGKALHWVGPLSARSAAPRLALSFTPPARLILQTNQSHPPAITRAHLIVLSLQGPLPHPCSPYSQVQTPRHLAWCVSFSPRSSVHVTHSLPSGPSGQCRVSCVSQSAQRGGSYLR